MQDVPNEKYQNRPNNNKKCHKHILHSICRFVCKLNGTISCIHWTFRANPMNTHESWLYVPYFIVCSMLHLLCYFYLAHNFIESTSCTHIEQDNERRDLIPCGEYASRLQFSLVRLGKFPSLRSMQLFSNLRFVVRRTMLELCISSHTRPYVYWKGIGLLKLIVCTRHAHTHTHTQQPKYLKRHRNREHRVLSLECQ